MIVKIDLKNPKYCDGCPYLACSQDYFCKKYQKTLHASYKYSTIRNHAHRLLKCAQENGL